MEESDSSQKTKSLLLPSGSSHTDCETDGFPSKNIFCSGVTPPSDAFPTNKREKKPVTTVMDNKKIQMTFANPALNMSKKDIQKTLQQAQALVNDANKTGYQMSSATIPLQKSGDTPGKTYQVNIQSANNVMIGGTNTIYQQKISNKEKKEETLNDNSAPSLDPIFQTKLDFLMDCDRLLTEVQINQTAAMIGKDWRRVLRTMGMDDNELDAVHHDYYNNGLQEIIFQGLLKWSHKYAPCKVKDLAQNLHKLGKMPDLEKLYELVKASG